MLPKLVQTFICFSALIAYSATDALPVHDDRQPVEANPHQTATPIAEDKSALNNHHSHLVGPRMSAAEDQHDASVDKGPVLATAAPIAAQLSLSAADLATRTSQSLSSTEQSGPLSENNSRLDGSATQTEGSSAKGKAITQDGGDGQRGRDAILRAGDARCLVNFVWLVLLSLDDRRRERAEGGLKEGCEEWRSPEECQCN